MSKQGYIRCHLDHYAYIEKQNVLIYIIFLLYVDDMLIVGCNMQKNNMLKGNWKIHLQ